MNIYLLTHQRELGRKSNSGVLVADELADKCRLFVWDRVNPNPELLDRLKHENIALVYPGEGSVDLADTTAVFDSYILIDATWQEALKMYNHSPYLKGLKKVSIDSGKPSIYTLRRNQKETGLCTAECVIELLKHSADLSSAAKLEQRLNTLVLDQGHN